jgi:CheY-like chemotaxis protein
MNKILVVDDIAVNRALLRRMLEPSGYTVIEAGDGAVAMDVFREQDPDLILMDINMPGVNGHQATETIKQMAGGDHVPVIFVTALKTEASLSEALACGGDDFISKPVNMQVLESKVLAHLRIRYLNRQLKEKNAVLEKHNSQLERQQELIDYFFENALQQSFLDPAYIKHHISPVAAFNGDLLLLERGPNGGLYVLLGDFTGHGLSAAMGTLPVAQVFFKMARKGLPISDIAREMNHHLVTLMPVDMFFSATLLELDKPGTLLSVWAGGMPDAYLLGSGGELKYTLRSRHMPMGILADDAFSSELESFSVSSSDRVYLGSDGVIEASSESGEMFGEQRLLNALCGDAAGRFDDVLDALRHFRGEKDQEDDITFLEVACKAVPAPAQGGKAVQQARIPPFRISVTLSAEEIRTLDPVVQFTGMLASQPGLAEHRSVLHTLLAEMYSNALEHGLLGLDSSAKTDEEQFVSYYQRREEALRKLEQGCIMFDIAFERESRGGRLKIRVTNSGAGFAPAASEKNTGLLYGRGMQILSALCESVSYSNEGRTLEAVYRVC